MLRNWFNATAIAFMFLTRLPMPRLKTITPEDEGRALVCFPGVGLVLGLLLVLIALGLQNYTSPMVVSAIIVTLWVAVTGSLHLDGLADSADGWLSGANGERALEIMKDPRCGSAAVCAVACVLLLKFAALATLIEQGSGLALLLVPLISRSVAPLLFLTTPYANPKGIALNYIEHAPAYTRYLMGFLLVCSLVIVTWLSSASVLACSTIFLMIAAAILLLRRMMLQRLSGITGDTAGATIEISEALLLIGFTVIY